MEKILQMPPQSSEAALNWRTLLKTAMAQWGKVAEALKEEKAVTPTQQKSINIYSTALWAWTGAGIWNSQLNSGSRCEQYNILPGHHGLPEDGHLCCYVARSSHGCTGTSATLGLLILQSYKQEMEEGSLSSLAPVHMVLQMEPGQDEKKLHQLPHRSALPHTGPCHMTHACVCVSVCLFDFLTICCLDKYFFKQSSIYIESLSILVSFVLYP
ncbi:uncharacterized protein LOC134443404 isoform X2 [Engraulis encrasicolus]|uniref:uncharacterized protein LOC134443404 isoform X2 n=1 Tax=Engraulis encrasicolus TaxID=184585 RepID=UPI002FD78FEC